MKRQLVLLFILPMPIASIAWTVTHEEVFRGRAVYDKVAQTWTLEIRRRLVTGDDKDVQFDDLARKYKWGVAVFDNAQIEHSVSGTPISLVFGQTVSSRIR